MKRRFFDILIMAMFILFIGPLSVYAGGDCNDDLCDPCYLYDETGWAADGCEPGKMRYTERGNWATYVEFEDRTDPKTVNLYAGQYNLAGEVTFTPSSLGVAIEICLYDSPFKWKFADKEENVKIQGYLMRPSGNPAPGRFDDKVSAPPDQRCYTVFVQDPFGDSYKFYGVHVDLEAWCDDPDTITNSIGMTFNYIEPCTFMMGSPEDEPGRLLNETQHEVTLTQGYYMQTTEVTQGQWKAVMGSNPSNFSNCGDDCPVEYVSWDDAQDFITALNTLEGTTRYALPTEAQWEYAARAGSTTAFANGEITEIGSGYDPVLDSMGWYWYNSQVDYSPNWGGKGTHPVAQKAPNAWGLYDMHGNVWEWVADCYSTYPTEAVTDPMGPAEGTNRVIRGGSWRDSAGNCRSASRYSGSPGRRESNKGFRLVLLSGH